MSKERLLQLQFALFFSSIENRPDKFISKIDEALEGIFDQMPTILPIPADAPPEIPVVIMQSSNGEYVCNIAKTRIDFITNFNNSAGSITVQLENFLSRIRLFSEVIFGYKSIVRFGLVGRYFYKYNDPISLIHTKYFKQDLGDLEELNLRFNKKFERNGLSLNDIVEIGKGIVNDKSRGQQTGVIIQRDLNNVPVNSLRIEDMVSILESRQDTFKLSGILELVE